MSNRTGDYALDEAASEAVASRPVDCARRRPEPEKLDSRNGKIIELRFFGGMSIEETALAAGISTAP